MIQKLLLGAILAFMFQLSSYGYETKDVIKQLDEKIDHRGFYNVKKKSRINYLKLQKCYSNELKFENYQNLFDEYYNYRIDSSLYYAKRLIELSAQSNDIKMHQVAIIYYAKYFNGMCMYKEAANLLFPLKDKILPILKDKYYETLSQYYVWLTEYTSNDIYKSIYCKKAFIYTDSLLKYRNKNSVEYKLSLAEYYRYNNIDKAITTLIPVIDTMSVNNADLRLVACNLAESYEKINDLKSAKYYYTISALSDIENGIKEHCALHKLALIMSKEGDIDRAYSYLKCCIDDANFSNAKLRIFESVPDFSKIYELYQSKKVLNKRTMELSIVTLAILLIGLLITLLLLYKSNKKLNIERLKVVKYNDQLMSLNDKMKITIDKQTCTNLALNESNKIKVAYIVQYMRNCISYIDKLNNYRHTLNKFAISNNKSMLYDELKSTRIIDEELKSFYKEFDKTFLSLFPTFVDEFNSLLNDDEIIDLPINTLNPELRIFALIRLGVTDSNDIASFLQYSVKTIYNYRVKVRKNAKCNRSDLEEKIKNIGTVMM